MPTDRRQALLTLKYDMIYRGLESAKANERFAVTLVEPPVVEGTHGADEGEDIVAPSPEK